MDSAGKPHAVCVPFPLQGHITPMLKLSLVLHSKGFHITFVNTHYNHKRLLKSRGHSSLHGLPDFRFQTIPDGLPTSDDAADVSQDVLSLFKSTMTSCLLPFRRILAELNDPSSGAPPVTCIIADGCMAFTLDAAEELGVPEVILWTGSVCSLLAYFHFEDLFARGFAPLKDMSQLHDKEFMETAVEGLPGLDGVRFKDFPTYIRTADPDDFMVILIITDIARAQGAASAVLFNTFEELDRPFLEALAAKTPPFFSLGPVSLLSRQIPPRFSIGSNLLEEDRSCLEWLQGKPAASVLYISFGSVVEISNQQLVELAWGLANSGHSFLWVHRGDPSMLPEEFLEETTERGRMTRWCPQVEVLNHPAVGGFLTHCGWNSTLEAISGGVPMLCLPDYADEQITCRYLCTRWGIGMEIDSDVKRGEVELLVRELMGGEKGREMRARAAEWKQRAVAASIEGGSSFDSVDKFINHIVGR